VTLAEIQRSLRDLFASGDIAHESIPYLFLGSFAINASLAVYFLPETKGLNLPQTMEEAKDQEKLENVF